ncbi:hypothetical protein LIS82_09020 [Cytobacillus solani]|uniref:hypothetical protein n=1 Tax=Cytobacillus solani TaxID=1637975 RepID=UPI00207A8EB6|nr:hypothetical protein [Cytobacillus solani]USK56593.1 hypothetical protein LIS82_09020 [Cytobacillus solani]
MKKCLVILLAVIFLTACGGDKETSTSVNKDTESTEEKSSEPTQEELNDKLKSEAIQAVFVELNSDNTEVNKKVFALGKVSAIGEEGIFKTFLLTTEESNGLGVYKIVDVLKEVEYQEGDSIKIYGTYDGKEESTGMPKITSTVIEKQ